MMLRIGILFLLGMQTAYAMQPDIPRHYFYRNAMFENLADEILNSAEKQNITLYRNQILTTIQGDLNPVLDEVVLQAEKYPACATTDEECIQKQYAQLLAAMPRHIENNYFKFYNYQKFAWTKMFIAPKNGWALLNEWYPQYIKSSFGLEHDSLCAKNTNYLFLNMRVMFYRLKADVSPHESHVSKSMFTAYYNHCVHILREPSIILHEYRAKTAEVDSLMNIAISIPGSNNADIANVYMASAFNDYFVIAMNKAELLEVFNRADYLLGKALQVHESGKAHYAIGALYNNFIVDYGNLFAARAESKTGTGIPNQQELVQKAIIHLEDACALDNEYCNLRKFRDKKGH